ncbi:hypothetical protein C0431_12365 [bacterium]|nr:hypothetical protein [bacterium]
MRGEEEVKTERMTPVGRMLERVEQLEAEKIRRDLAKLKNNTEKVGYLMDRFPGTVSDNNLLCVLFWRYAEGARTLNEVIGKTKADSIIRTRQLVEKKRRETEA